MNEPPRVCQQYYITLQSLPVTRLCGKHARNTIRSLGRAKKVTVKFHTGRVRAFSSLVCLVFWHGLLWNFSILFVSKRMAESSEVGPDKPPSELATEEDSETDVDDPSPYDNDKENVDIESFVNTIPRDVNEWQIYRTDNFTLDKIGDGFFGDIYKVLIEF